MYAETNMYSPIIIIAVGFFFQFSLFNILVIFYNLKMDINYIFVINSMIRQSCDSFFQTC